MPPVNFTAIVTGAPALPYIFNNPLQQLDDAIKKNNYAAAAAPTVNDDAGDGYSVGSRWINTTNALLYVCLDATVGAAVWKMQLNYGATLPAQPAYGSNVPFFLTGLGWWCYYTGTNWLTCEEFSFSGVALAQAASAVLWESHLRTDYAPYFTRVALTTKVAAPNDGTDHWTIAVRGQNLAHTAATNVHLFNTGADTVATYTLHEGAPNATANPSNRNSSDVEITKNNTPGNIDLYATWFYRLILA